MMDHTPEWAKAFGFTDADIKQWESKNSEGQSLIFFVLKNEIISRDNYTQWAFQHFSLPKLKRGFFDTSPPPKELLQRYSNIWPDHVVPIKEWDGTLYLACLEPVEDLNLPQKAQWVIAHFDDLVPFKQNIESKSAEHAPNGLEISLDLKTDDLPPLEANELPTDTNSPKEEKKSKDEMGDLSLSDSADLGTLSFNLNELKSENEANDTEEVTDTKTDVIEVSPPVEKKPTLEAQQPSEEPEIIRPMNVHETSQTNDLEEDKTQVLTSKPIEEVPHVQPEPTSTKTNLTLVEENVESTDTNSSPFKEGEEDEYVSEVTAITRVNLPGPDGLAKIILNDLSNYYEKSMILLFTDGELKPWKWTDEWKQDGTRSPVIDLTSPSVFRIVKESKHPYHGYVVPNAVNDAFFLTWSNGNYPEHLTLLPMIVEGNLLGILCGTTSKLRGDRIKLDRMLDLSKEIAQRLLQVQSAA